MVRIVILAFTALSLTSLASRSAPVSQVRPITTPAGCRCTELRHVMAAPRNR